NSSKKINDINLDIDVLENALDENNKEIKKVKKEVENFEDEIDKTKKEIDVLEQEIEERNEILKERLSSYQKDGGEVGFMEVIFGSVSFEDFISRYTAVNEITKDDNELIKKKKEKKKEITKVNQIKKDQKNDLTESKQEVEKEITKLKEQKEEYVAKGNDLEALEARVEEEINSNESRSENEQIVQTATTTET